MPAVCSRIFCAPRISILLPKSAAFIWATRIACPRPLATYASPSYLLANFRARFGISNARVPVSLPHPQVNTATYEPQAFVPQQASKEQIEKMRIAESKSSTPGEHGYEPQAFVPQQASKEQIEKTDKTDKELPEWWPTNADGSHISHVYRLIDEDQGSDIRCPEIDKAMSHILKPETPVDLGQNESKEQAIKHISKVPEGTNWKERPFCRHQWT